MPEHRIERDSLGEVRVPVNCYWGAQTQRSIENFPIGSDRMPQPIIRAYAFIKQAAALANAELGALPAPFRDPIVRACDEILDDRLADQFPLLVWQTGSGTQTNMNVNEVVANRATELLGHDFRVEKVIHPNDHVNASQSSNDTFPTAMHLAAYHEVTHTLLPAVARLEATLAGKRDAWADVVKIGRTHLMDATPLTLGQEFGGYAAQLADAAAALRDSLPRLADLPIGGTAVGTGINAPPGFAASTVAHLARLTGLPVTGSGNRFAALSAHDTLVELSGQLNRLAVSLLHIANQIRLLASGPRAGLAELVLPANEPGSSIMPGKVNPTQCEALAMVAVRAMGNHTTVTLAGSHGHLQLNTFKPVIAHCVLESTELLAAAAASFEKRCARGIEPNRQRIAELGERSLMLVTALTPAIGYEKAAEIAKKAFAENLSIREAATALGVLDAARLSELLDPRSMLGDQ